MSLYNTSSDAANTAVRSYLTKIGEFYYKKNFNTASGPAQKDWHKIRDVVFGSTCAYCGRADMKLEMDHLIMFNRTGYGLHHPGNVVPACTKCNTRSRKADSEYNTWEEHLSFICEKNMEKDKFQDRWNKIRNHISQGEFSYPKLTSEEENAIRIIANWLYDNIKHSFDNAISLYQELDVSFSKSKK